MGAKSSSIRKFELLFLLICFLLSYIYFTTPEQIARYENVREKYDYLKILLKQ